VVADVCRRTMAVMRVSEKKREAALATLLALFAVATVEDLGQRTWQGETIKTTQEQQAAVDAAQAELERQKRILTRRDNSTPQQAQIASIDQTLQILTHLQYQLENWLIAHSDSLKPRQRRRTKIEPR